MKETGMITSRNPKNPDNLEIDYNALCPRVVIAPVITILSTDKSVLFSACDTFGFGQFGDYLSREHILKFLQHDVYTHCEECTLVIYSEYASEFKALCCVLSKWKNCPRRIAVIEQPNELFSFPTIAVSCPLSSGNCRFLRNALIGEILRNESKFQTKYPMVRFTNKFYEFSGSESGIVREKSVLSMRTGTLLS